MSLLRWMGVGHNAHNAESAAAAAAVVAKAPAPAELKRFGLENFGNTCYVNAIFQALYFCGPFRELVLASADPFHDAELAAQPHPPPPPPASLAPPPKTTGPTSPIPLTSKSPSKSGTKRPATTTPATGAAAPAAPEPQDTPGIPANPPTLFSALRSLFWYIAQNSEDKGAVSPLAFVNKVRREHDTFRSAAHQDAHEFMNYLLNKIGEEIEHVQRERERERPVVEDLSRSQTTSSSSHHAKTFVHALFEGVLTSETRCLTCENVSARDESFIDLSIDIEQNSSVTACLRSFSASEMLCQRNKFFCDHCCGLQEAEKRMKIKKLPNVLALHLKRFKFQEEQQRYVKLAYRVAFPNELRLFNTVDEPEGGSPDRLYELFAIVVHIGAGPHHGHYIAIVRTRGVWLVYDDNAVDTLKDDQISKYFGDGNGGSGYVLFYQAVDIDRDALGLPSKAATPLQPASTPAPTILNGHSQEATITDSPPQAVNGLPPIPDEHDYTIPIPRPVKPRLEIPSSSPPVTPPTAEPASATATTNNRTSGIWRNRRTPSLRQAPHTTSEDPPPLPQKLQVPAASHEKDKSERSGWTSTVFRRTTRDKGRKARESASESIPPPPRTPTSTNGSGFTDNEAALVPTAPPHHEFATVGKSRTKTTGPFGAIRRPSTEARRGSIDALTPMNGHAVSSQVSLGPASTLGSRPPSNPAQQRTTPNQQGHSYALMPAHNASTATTLTSHTTSSASGSSVPALPLNDPATTRARKNSGARGKLQMLVDSVSPGSTVPNGPSHAHSPSESDIPRKRVSSAVFSPATVNGTHSIPPLPTRSHTSGDFSFTIATTSGNGVDIGASPAPAVKPPGRKMSLTGGLRALGIGSGKDKDRDRERPPPVWEGGTGRNGY